MEATLEEISQEKGTGFCRGIGNGITRMMFVNGDRQKQIREISGRKPLFNLGTAVGAVYMGIIYAVPAGIVAYNIYKALS